MKKIALTEQLGLRPLPQDGFEDAQQGFGELVVEVVLRVDGNAVLQHVDGVLGVVYIRIKLY